MAQFTISNIKIRGMSAAVPENEISNWDYKWISKKDRASVIKNIGVGKKRVAPKGMTTSDLCYAAAEKLIDELGWEKKEIEALVFVTQSGDYIIPASAAILQDRLGLPHNCMALDINLGCSGYVYGLSMLGGLMSASKMKKALLLVGDLSAVTSSYRDKSTYPLFGDSGTVTALEYLENAPDIPFNLQTDGSGHQAIMIPDGGVRNLVSKKSLENKKISKGIYRSRMHVVLDGIEVFNFSLREVVPNIKRTLAYANRSLDDFDYFIFHQANRMINETIRKMLKLDKEKVPYSIHKFGNTSGASLPLTMISEIRDELRTKKLKLSLTAFGIGLSWGTAFIETDRIICPDILEI
ncbi:MAG: ketoacyl-ACP synthase III [Bacteroidales bacterium]|nr:ketoacyl-ACP synthase III [Bacteroidales bacterium]MCF8386776.1 ketoacyl-ACP synthase III [Bacteroidales bacterium]MCF8398223.1 ketoacyl-ACP synthase III [Bacteroidales bacterium]